MKYSHHSTARSTIRSETDQEFDGLSLLSHEDEFDYPPAISEENNINNNTNNNNNNAKAKKFSAQEVELWGTRLKCSLKLCENKVNNVSFENCFT
eukprot:Pgem_evm1s15469